MILLSNFFQCSQPRRIGLHSPIGSVSFSVVYFYLCHDLFDFKFMLHGLSIPYPLPAELSYWRMVFAKHPTAPPARWAAAQSPNPTMEIWDAHSANKSLYLREVPDRAEGANSYLKYCMMI
jgi:hypothetical protein